MENVRRLREHYVTLTGEELEVPVGKVNLFLARVRQAAESPSVDVDGITALVWSLQNPLLTPSPVSGAPMATRETYEEPAFRIMLDCISRKRASTGELDLSAAAKKYTVPVPEAAAKLGIVESSIRRAIASGRLTAWRKGGAYFLDPASVDAYHVSIRGAKALPQFREHRADPQQGVSHRTDALELEMGTEGDFMLRAKYSGKISGMQQLPGGHVWGWLPKGWQRVAILTGNKATGSYRFHVLTPTEGDPWNVADLTYAGFRVHGHFAIEGKPITNPKKATEAWEAFKAE